MVGKESERWAIIPEFVDLRKLPLLCRGGIIAIAPTSIKEIVCYSSPTYSTVR